MLDGFLGVGFGTDVEHLSGLLCALLLDVLVVYQVIILIHDMVHLVYVLIQILVLSVLTLLLTSFAVLL